MGRGYNMPVSSQLCIVVKLVAGYKYLHVTVRGLASGGNLSSFPV